MSSSYTNEIRRQGAAPCLVAGPALILTSDFAYYTAGNAYACSALLKLGLIFMVGAALAIVHLLRDRADRIGLVGGALTVAGCLTGSSLATAQLYERTLRGLPDAGIAGAFASALDASGLYMTTVFVPFPGPLFPLGLIILGVTLLWTGAVARTAAACLILGGILFPIGRAVGVVPAVFGCDAMLVLGLGAIALHVLAQPGSWSAASHAPQPDQSGALARA